MNAPAVAALVGLGAIGLYAIGSAAVAHKRAIRAGEMPTHVPEEYDSSVAQDLVAFTASMVVFVAVCSQTPVMISEVQEMLR